MITASLLRPATPSRLSGLSLNLTVLASWQAKEIFLEADDDGSGALDLEEVAEMLKKMMGYEMAQSDLVRVQKEMDTDGDGQVDLSELCEWMQSDSGKKLMGESAAAAAAAHKTEIEELPRLMAEKEAVRFAEARAGRLDDDNDSLLPPDVERTS
jgi:hypothetical protein